MHIDLSDPEQFTLEDVGRLLASTDDSRDRQLRVTRDGRAFISDDVGADNIEGLLFRFETWDEGNGYLGQPAGANQEFVNRIYLALRQNWPRPKSSYIDLY